MEPELLAQLTAEERGWCWLNTEGLPLDSRVPNLVTALRSVAEARRDLRLMEQSVVRAYGERDTAIADLRRCMEALESVLEHVGELEEAWKRGAISEHDGLGGLRSNRNVGARAMIQRVLADLQHYKEEK